MSNLNKLLNSNKILKTWCTIYAMFLVINIGSPYSIRNIYIVLALQICLSIIKEVLYDEDYLVIFYYTAIIKT